MKPKKIREEQLRQARLATSCTPQSLGLDPELYEAALRFLFDRAVPDSREKEWYWETDAPPFEATPLEWTRIQTLLFANAESDLRLFNNEQVGGGLDYLIRAEASDVPFAAVDATVPIEDAMLMMQALPNLWRQCIGPRLESVPASTRSDADRLGYVCYMWFDIWPTFGNLREHQPWRSVSELQTWKDAVWNVLKEMLDVPCREVQIAALHGIGHNIQYLDARPIIERTVAGFLKNLVQADPELQDYAAAALQGRVQ